MAKRIPASLRPVLTRDAERLRAIFGERVRELRLFGSYARGEANEDSDVDVLVLVDGLTDEELGVVFEQVAPFILETGSPSRRCPWPQSASKRYEKRSGFSPAISTRRASRCDGRQKARRPRPRFARGGRPHRLLGL